MNKIVIAGLVGVVVLGAGYSLVASQKEAEMAKKQMMEEEKMMMEKAETEKMEMEKNEMEAKAMMEKEVVMNDETMMKDKAMEGEAMMKKDEGAMMMSKGSYEVYNASKLAMAEKGDVVLFFKASWCPSCRALDADIKANLGSIKDGLTILEVNYDTETALKQKYGVTAQHTLVQVDKDGNLIAKWSGSGTLAALQGKVQ